MASQASEHVVATATPHPQRLAASGGNPLNTSIPARWLSMKPCPFWLSNGCPRRTVQPNASTAAAKSRSSFSCAGQHVMLALGRRSPLAIV